MGTKRVGIALSDDAGSMAFPSVVLTADEQLFQKINSRIVAERVDVVVIGDSRNRDNTQNAIQHEALSLGANLEKQGIRVVYEWEGYSSAHARTLHHFVEGTPRGVVSRMRGHKAKRTHVDASAAALILQSYIDRHR